MMQLVTNLLTPPACVFKHVKLLDDLMIFKLKNSFANGSLRNTLYGFRNALNLAVVHLRLTSNTGYVWLCMVMYVCMYSSSWGNRVVPFSPK